MVRAQSPRTGFLNAILGLILIPHQMDSDPIEVIEMNHDLR
jgi:hypothetical protein